ncbi:MAG: class I SAM-dependent methyltransferase [Lachnospiraceae bacterium]|nr:class I SAM-dependent methyltransferase [Lachnospiraceae bacterium]
MIFSFLMIAGVGIISIWDQVRSDDNVLECACGTGLLSTVIARNCKTLTATDFAPKMLQKAEKNCSDYDNVTFRQGNMLIGYTCSSRNTQLKRRRQTMETRHYEVVSIDGDYANLRRTDIDTDDMKLVARALLPEEISLGSHLVYEMMQYEIEE